MNKPTPDRIASVEQLEEMLSQPDEGVTETFARLKGDVIVLGVGGKMGPSLARMIRRASEAAGVKRRVIGVARFSSKELPQQLQGWGIETQRCDLLDAAQFNELPDAPNVVYMAALKFGATGQESLAWAMNTFLPGMVAQKYRSSRIIAFSTGNVYGLSPVVRGGSVETDTLNPVGDYALSCLGRERIFEHFSRTLQIPTALIRLNYAVEMRYGVLADLAQNILSGKPVDLSMGNANVIWQRDANAMSLRCFDHTSTPPFVLNVAGPEILSLRRVSEELGRHLGKTPIFTGAEAGDALISNGQLGHRLMGYPQSSIQQIIKWTADWVKQGGETLGKPTHFETRDGKF